MEKFGKFCVGFLLLIGNMFVRAWVVTLLWRWFILHQFQAPEINYAEALGLSLFVSLLTANVTRPPKDEEFWEPMLRGLILNLGALFFGYLYSFYL